MDSIDIITRFLFVVLNVYGLIKFWKFLTKPSIVGPIYVVFVLFFCLPVVFDFFIGIPEYNSKFYNFKRAAEHLETSIVYNLYMIFISVLFITKINSEKYFVNTESIGRVFVRIYKRKGILLFLGLLPLFILPFVDDVGMYLTYRALNANYEVNRGAIDALLINSTTISVFASILYWFLNIKYSNKSYKGIVSCLLFLLVFCAAFINGKRYILAIIIILLLGLYYLYGIKSKKKILISTIMLSALLLSFLSFYGKNIGSNFSETYTGFRIDFGRDDVTKYVIYKEFFLEESILEYPLQSFLFDFTFFVPREIFLEKPYPYSVYLTNRLLDIDLNEPLGWSMTSSIFEECLSNLGLLGFLFPIFYFYLLKRVNKLSVISFLIGFFILMMLVVVQFSAINFLGILFIISIFLFKNDNEDIRQR